MREQILKLMDEKKDQIKLVGIVVHGGTIMSLLSRYYGGEYFDYQVSNGGGYLCTMQGWNEAPKIVNIKKL